MPQSYLPCQTEWFAPVSFCEKNHEKRKKSDAAPDARKKAVPKAPNFGTLHAVRNLKNAEFGDKQAVTLVETLQDAQSELATRANVENTGLALRTDMEKMELRIRRDLEKMELRIRGDMEKMELRIRADMEAGFSRLSWQILASASGATAVGTSIISLLILFK